MVELYQKLKGAVNVYTMDHRGTGRSSRLDCVAAQATTTGAPDFSASEALSCAQDLQFQYDDFSSFSVTTAATDLATLISKVTNRAPTIVYGVSYGTVLVERLIHLAPSEVTGYVLDSVATSSGAPAGKFEYVSTYDIDLNEMGEAFLALCEKDEGCNKHFQSRQLNETIQDLLTRLDKEPTSACASIITQVNSTSLDGRPSSALRFLLGTLLKVSFTRSYIPPIAYHVNVLKHFVDVYNEYLINKHSQDDAYTSEVLLCLITFSELWEQPAPSKTEMEARIAATKFTDEGAAYRANPIYCVFSKEQSSSCQAYGLANYTGNPIIYARDQYWNKSATIPTQASVLLLSGKLDPLTKYEYAEYLLESLKGDNKELITFEYATHGITTSTNMIADNPLSETCGTRLLVSYVDNGGNLARLDKSCVNAMPPFSLAIPPEGLPEAMGTDEAYDGEYIVTNFTTRKTQG
ncbi:hypothetical protein PsorP6_013919 [Peronosclerospora sorghi]|uniref:Uncharacterized protein n=1 Tax=Peronosclerospora sorghi TaxID=230839 RepID=A0ACC0VGZ0_9STRA|nr:hypothetical protein PsorP6_013919 [Peronosclerospora sorghi]